MQALLDHPREALTAAQVQSILAAPALIAYGGCDLLDLNMVWQSDISADLISGSVKRQMYADIHGTCTLQLGSTYPWGIRLFRPYTVLADANNPAVTARFDLGVFSLATPKTDANDIVRTCTGYDRLYFLRRSIGRTYVIPAGTEYLAAMRQVIADAGLAGVVLDGSAAGKTLPLASVYPLVPPVSADPNSIATDTTWLRVFNDLAAAIGYRGCWTDQLGQYRSEPYTNPASRGVEWTFDATSPKTLIGRKRTLVNDIWAIPNQWTFIQQNATVPPTVANGGVYVVINQSDGIGSIDQRGMIWPKTVRIDAADAGSLQTQGNRIVAQDKSITTVFTVETGPFPLAGHFDVISYVDGALFDATNKVVATAWEQDLKGGNTQWTWETP